MSASQTCAPKVNIKRKEVTGFVRNNNNTDPYITRLEVNKVNIGAYTEYLHIPREEYDNDQPNPLLTLSVGETCGDIRTIRTNVFVKGNKIVAGEVDAPSIKTTSIQPLVPGGTIDLGGLPFTSGSVSTGGSGPQLGSFNTPIQNLYVTNIISPKNPIWKLYERYSSGIKGGDMIRYTWNIRKFNVEELYNTQLNILNPTLPGTDKYILFLPFGEYSIFWISPAFNCGSHKSRLFNLDNNTEIGVGSNAFSQGSVSTSVGKFTFKLENPMTRVQLQHWCSETRSLDGMGTATKSDGTPELYASIELEKTK